MPLDRLLVMELKSPWLGCASVSNRQEEAGPGEQQADFQGSVRRRKGTDSRCQTR